MILGSGISPWMGLRSWMSLQAAHNPESSGPAHLGITRCRRAVRPPREVRAELQRRPRRTAEDRTRLNPDLNIRTSIWRDQVRFHERSRWSVSELCFVVFNLLFKRSRWSRQSVQTRTVHEETPTGHLRFYVAVWQRPQHFVESCHRILLLFSYLFQCIHLLSSFWNELLLCLIFGEMLSGFCKRKCFMCLSS